MNSEMLKLWLSNYKQAWENRDPHAARELFSEDATYQETPFDEPMRGRDAIYSYWEDVTKTQENINFEFEILMVKDEFGIAHWNTSYIRSTSGVKVFLDGIFILFLNNDGKCTKLREWWHTTEK